MRNEPRFVSRYYDLDAFCFFVLFSYFYRFGQPVLFARFNTNFGFGAGFKERLKREWQTEYLVGTQSYHQNIGRYYLPIF